MIVIDASALTAIILKEEGWESLLDASDLFISVDLLHKEVANAIWAASLSGRISEENAKESFSLLKEFIQHNVILRPQARYLDKALEIALKHKITVYDSIYIALSIEEILPLLTLDSEQARVAWAEGVKPIGW
ncbi:MAG: type II toxin-antitoxin system VapC family toxin [Candidatus Korarchaeota archaeon]|nr:type II toxin-antitoxin system VapC family toxin [Candidatus Korarchaeota archaeon]